MGIFIGNDTCVFEKGDVTEVNRLRKKKKVIHKKVDAADAAANLARKAVIDANKAVIKAKTVLIDAKKDYAAGQIVQHSKNQHLSPNCRQDNKHKRICVANFGLNKKDCVSTDGCSYKSGFCYESEIFNSYLPDGRFEAFNNLRAPIINSVGIKLVDFQKKMTKVQSHAD